jgi:site-specific recombinase XerD
VPGAGSRTPAAGGFEQGREEHRTKNEGLLARARQIAGLVAGGAPADTSALWLARPASGSPHAAFDLVLRRLGQEARLQLSAHTLRHTCFTGLVRRGNDLVLVAELAGHRRLETTRRRR